MSIIDVSILIRLKKHYAFAAVACLMNAAVSGILWENIARPSTLTIFLSVLSLITIVPLFFRWVYSYLCLAIFLIITNIIFTCLPDLWTSTKEAPYPQVVPIVIIIILFFECLAVKTSIIFLKHPELRHYFELAFTLKKKRQPVKLPKEDSLIKRIEKTDRYTLLGFFIIICGTTVAILIAINSDNPRWAPFEDVTTPIAVAMFYFAGKFVTLGKRRSAAKATEILKKNPTSIILLLRSFDMILCLSNHI